MSDLRTDEFKALVDIGLRTVGERAREFLTTVAALPPAPNTFSQDAALHLGLSDVSQLESPRQLGLITKPSTGRYSITRPVHEVLKSQKPDYHAVTRLVNYYSRYADIFQTQVTAIECEYDNICSAMQIGRDIGAGENLLMSMTVCLSRALDLRGDYKRWSKLLKEAITGSREGADPALKAVAIMHLARLDLKSGKLLEAEVHAREALDLNPSDASLRVDTLITLGHVLLDKGDLQHARGYLEQALSLAREYDWPSAARQAVVILGALLTRLGRYPEAASITEQAMADANQTGDLAVFASLATNLGVIYYYQGLYAKAVETDERGLAIARQIGFREKEGALLQAKGGALIEVGDAEQALISLAEALNIFVEIDHRWYIGITRKEQGEAYLKIGDIPNSVKHFKMALQEGAPEAQDVLGYSHWGLARAFREQGNTREAMREAGAALEVFGPSHRMAPIIVEWLSRDKQAYHITIVDPGIQTRQ